MRNQVNVAALAAAFDYGIRITEGLVNKASLIPTVGRKAKTALEQVKAVRKIADERLATAVKPVQNMLNTIVMRLEREALARQHGILNANNVHFRGALPEATAIKLMSKPDVPEWLSKGKKRPFPGLNYAREKHAIEQQVKDGWSELNQQNVESFHKMAAKTVEGPARLYRILAPNSRGMSDCWVSEEVFNKLQSAPDPRAAWRKYLAVWPDWNVNGQFVIYDVKPGEKLKVWRGPASSQVRDNLPDRHLEGGYEQIIFKLDRDPLAKLVGPDPRADTMLYYKVNKGKTTTLGKPMTQADVDKMTAGMDKQQKELFYHEHLALRERINHPNISGPFETGWGYTDFDGAGFLDKIGLPALPGQTTQLIK